MDTPTVASEIASMHSIFVRISGLECRQMAHEAIWYRLVLDGYSAADVEIFLLWIKYENSDREERYRRRFHIPKMFGNPAEFDADLGVAKAWYRNRRGTPTPRETALEQLRPTVDPELAKARLKPAQSAGEVLGRILRGQPNP